MTLERAAVVFFVVEVLLSPVIFDIANGDLNIDVGHLWSTAANAEEILKLPTLATQLKESVTQTPPAVELSVARRQILEAEWSRRVPK